MNVFCKIIWYKKYFFHNYKLKINYINEIKIFYILDYLIIIDKNTKKCFYSKLFIELDEIK